VFPLHISSRLWTLQEEIYNENRVDFFTVETLKIKLVFILKSRSK